MRPKQSGAIQESGPKKSAGAVREAAYAGTGLEMSRYVQGAFEMTRICRLLLAVALTRRSGF